MLLEGTHIICNGKYAGFLDEVFHCGGEKQVLSGLRQAAFDYSQTLVKVAIEHAIGFIYNQILQVIERKGITACKVIR